MPPKSTPKKTGVFTLADYGKRKSRTKPVVEKPKASRASGGRRLIDVFRSLPEADQVLSMHPSIDSVPSADFTDSDDDEYGDNEDLDEDDLAIIEQGRNKSESRSVEPFEVAEEVDDNIDEEELKRNVDNDPRFKESRIRLAKKIGHIAARAEYDGQKSAGKNDDELEDVLPDDPGGIYELVPDENGPIKLRQDAEGNYIEARSRRLLRPLSPRKRQRLDGNGRIVDEVIVSDRIMVRSVKRGAMRKKKTESKPMK